MSHTELHSDYQQEFVAFKPQRNPISDIGAEGIDWIISAFGSPINIIAIDQNNRKIGYSTGEVFDEIPEAHLDILGDKKVFHLPKDSKYTFRIEDKDTGTYNVTLFTTIGTDRRLIKIYGMETSDDSIDVVNINENLSELGLTTETSMKTYSMEIMIIQNHTLYSFTLKDMKISKGSVQDYKVLDWGNLSSTTTNSVKLNIDENSDGMPDYTVDLHNGMTGDDINYLQYPPSRKPFWMVLFETPEWIPIIPKWFPLPFVVIVLLIAVISVGILRRKKGRTEEKS